MHSDSRIKSVSSAPQDSQANLSKPRVEAFSRCCSFQTQSAWPYVGTLRPKYILYGYSLGILGFRD